MLIHRSDLAAPAGIGEKARRESGERLGSLARQLYPDGVLAAFTYDAAEAAAETAELIAGGASVIFEAAFLFDGLFARCDVIERVGDGWRVIEFKSATKVKEEHIEDVAFQTMVVRKAGLQVVQTLIGHVDSTNERGQAPLTPPQLFALEDVSSAVDATIPVVERLVDKIADVRDMPEAPVVETNIFCTKPYKCAFFAYCHEGQPEHDLTKMPGIRAERVSELRRNGIRTIDAIPDTERLSPVQLRVRNAVRNAQPYMSDRLAGGLAKVEYPAHFIDFEGAGPAIPLFEGMRSYQAFPFQWSDHVLESSSAEPQHFGFLDTTGGDPREAFAASLFEQIKDAKTVVFYSPYELTTVRTLAKQGVPYGAELTTILERRGFDLYKLVRDDVYLAEFGGSFSIKKVLPALVPDASYANLEIKDGDAAAAEYLRMCGTGTIDAEKQRIADALIAYCRQDTLAMVKLYQALVKLSASEIQPQSQPRLF